MPKEGWKYLAQSGTPENASLREMDRITLWLSRVLGALTSQGHFPIKTLIYIRKLYNYVVTLVRKKSIYLQWIHNYILLSYHFFIFQNKVKGKISLWTSWGIINRYNCVYFKSTTWFAIHVHCETLTKIKKDDPPITSHRQLYVCACVCVCWEHLRSTFLANFRYRKQDFFKVYFF